MPHDFTEVTFQLEPELGPDEFIAVLSRTSLGERRPIHDRSRVEGMLKHADLIVTARCSSQLVGVSRALTDYQFCTYLSDLAVDEAFQGRGIGKRLIEETHKAAGLKTMLILIAAPQAVTYYPHIGMQPHNSCWYIPRTE